MRMVGEHGELGIGMVGYAFMGRAHSQAWRSAVRFFDLPFTHEVRDLLHASAGWTKVGQ